jgi:glycosyltransferase involved in cell wall biosynthesis/2-polyprenyl-3-methyl-5-hydroxy-6-metoxy-1,4-benzoquinol methylase
MHWPRITIVTPSYNQGKYIERTVRSVLLQRYPNLDYILMDGGSTDDTVSRLAPYRNRFSFFASEPDNGQADAIAKGFARSSGEIMAYLNSDDLLAPGALQFVATFFEKHSDVDCIYSHRCTVDEDDQVQWYWILPPHSNSLMKRWDFIPQETCFWRRSLFEKAGNIDPSYHFAMDYDLFVRFMNLGRVRRINRFFGAFRQHSESKTTQLLGVLGRREMLKVRQKFGIRRLPHDGFFGMLLSRWISRAGHRFAYSKRSLPGALPGAGYDYNDMWGGVLRYPDVECEQNNQSEQDEQNKQKRTKRQKRLPYDPICPVTLAFPDRLLFTITSDRNGGALTSDIYISYKSRTAIILPSIGEHWKKLKSKSLDDQKTGEKSAIDGSSNLYPGASPVKSTMVEEIGRPPLDTDGNSTAGENDEADQILELTRRFVSESEEITFLHVGCATGQLLDALKARTKWKLYGLEACPSAAAQAISRGHQVFKTTLKEAPGLTEITQGFDLIYLGHRIERFDEPRVNLRGVAVLLNPDGFLVLSTPNLDSEQLRLSGPAWVHWKPEENRYIYSRKSLKRILALTGFQLAKLWTVSHPDSAAPGLKELHGRGAAVSTPGGHPISQNTNQTEVTSPCYLRRNRIGRGDLIFAICKRVS